MNSGEDAKQADNVTRRDFVRTSSAAILGSSLASVASAQAVHASGGDVLRVGVIGCGGRGRGAADNICTADQLLAEAGGAGAGRVEIVAVADAFQGQIDLFFQRLKRAHADRLKVDDANVFTGLSAYKGVLESDCDLVILATPPGFRPPHFEAAIDAGKHVFMEKPVAVDAPGVRQVLAAGERATQHSLAVGVGLQRRHDPKYLEAIDRIHSGEIGDLHLSRVYWNGRGVWVRSRSDFIRNLGREPNELEYQVYNWYYFNWLCGDHIVEQHIHNLDASNWAFGMVPESANGMGGREIRKGANHGQIFDHHFVEFRYPHGATMMSQCRHQPGCWNAVHEDLFAAKGKAELGGSRPCEVTIGQNVKAYTGPKVDPYVQEHIDLLKAIRTGSAYNETEYGATSTMTAILGRMATYSGKLITWDEAINSEISLAPVQPLAWDAVAPVLPDQKGRYPVAVPGEKTA